MTLRRTNYKTILITKQFEGNVTACNPPKTWSTLHYFKFSDLKQESEIQTLTPKFTPAVFWIPVNFPAKLNHHNQHPQQTVTDVHVALEVTQVVPYIQFTGASCLAARE